MRRVLPSTGGRLTRQPRTRQLSFIWTISFLCMLMMPSLQFAATPKETIKTIKSTILTKAVKATAKMSFMAPCPGGSGIVGGKVIGDFNYNGDNDQIGGVRNVEVVISVCEADGTTSVVGSTSTDWEGNFFMDGLTDGKRYRIDFIAPQGMYPGFGGSDFGTDIQFTTAPDCDIIASFTHPEDFYDEDPTVLATCFVNGDPIPSNSEANPIDVLVSFPHSSSGQLTPPSKWVTAGQAGSVYGLAYDRFTKNLYTSAFLKRHVGMGPLGIGGLYKIDNNNPMPQTAPFVDVKTIGINVGTIPSNSNRGLPTRLNQPSNDADAYAKIGKAGIGAIDVSYDGKVLWLVNLNDKKLYSLLTDADNNPATPPTASDVSSFTLPPASCSGGTFRPFAVKIYRGDVYVGGVCDAALSQDSMDLEAIVYRLRQNSFTEVLRFNLGYDKGWAASQNQCDFFPGWYAWTDQVPVACDQGPTRVYPQPILSDIEFDVDGSMILGFMDRLGHQLGNKNYPISGTSPLISTISGGDILRAYLEDNGEFSIENNGSAGPLTTGGAGNGEGPGGGEFYFRDVFEGQINNLIPPPHAETSQGGLAFWPGSGEVATTGLDPYSTVFNSGGINWMNNKTGAVRNPGYMLYRSASSSIQSFSKANGLGDLELASGLAPIQLGGMVWNDVNSNGIQDACENPLSNIKVGLYSLNGNRIATTTSNNKGEYYFDDTNVSQGLQKTTTYYVVFGVDGQFNTNSFQLNGTYFISQENIGMAPIADRTDSDITLALGGVANNAFYLLPYLQVRTGTYGWVDHSFDAGFTPENLNPIAGIGGYVWEDANRNGLQNSNENGIANVEVQLFSTTFGLQATTTTDANGNYFFSNVDNGTYYIYFERPSRMVGTLQNVGNGSNDSDANPITGSTPNFQFSPIDGDKNDVDAGFYKPTANLEGYVWEDSNENGLQDASENGIAGVTVRLLGTTGSLMNTTTTDANGNYTFNNLLAGNYLVEFVQPAGMVGTLQNVGNGTNDSDPNPATGRTNTINLDPFVGNVTDIDAGYYTPNGSISGYVWQDNNRNG
ncbi:MAG: carboxypeptidase regulatory-like domain-containing protein, partial [Saprospiraceae bacterium]|nr:carboxypeptidase regulatory-like domain-containing protein [Saprospiraceae bacterium]